MKKYLGVLLGIFILIIALVGCGSQNSDTSSSSNAPITTEGKDDGAVLRIAAQPYLLYTEVYGGFACYHS